MVDVNETLGGIWPYALQFSNAPGFRVHYVDEGQGASSLCPHDEPTWGILWREPASEAEVPALPRKPAMLTYGMRAHAIPPQVTTDVFKNTFGADKAVDLKLDKGAAPTPCRILEK